MGYLKVQFWVQFLFNAFLRDMFFMIDTVDIARNTDDNPPYSVKKNNVN